MDMDIQGTMAFLLGQQARFDAQMSELTEKMNLLVDQQIGTEEKHDREIADIRAVSASFRADLNRAVRSGIEEQRRERVRRQALEASLQALGVSVQALEVSVHALVTALHKDRGGNGRT